MSDEKRGQNQEPQPRPEPRPEPLIERRQEEGAHKSITPNVQPVDPWPQPSNPRDSENKEK